MTPKQLRTYRAIARAWGIQIVLVNDIGRYAYEGKAKIRIRESEVCRATPKYPRDPGPGWPSHELGHYMAATPYERTLPEWGLGISPTATIEAYHKNAYPRTRRSDDEVEAVASLLGIFLARYVEGPMCAGAIFENHCWDVQAAICYARKLRRCGKLVWHEGHLVPRMVVAPRATDVFTTHPRRSGTARGR